MNLKVIEVKRCNNCLSFDRTREAHRKYRCALTNDTINPLGLACFFHEPRIATDYTQVAPLDIYPRG